MMTGGLNLLGSNKRGDVYLVIVTDRNTHALRESPPTSWNLTASKKLAAAGQAVLNIRDAANNTTQFEHANAQLAQGQTSVSDRLRELTRLRDEQLITQAEFDQTRAKLIEDL
jgi:hypothetical protein